MMDLKTFTLRNCLISVFLLHSVMAMNFSFARHKVRSVIESLETDCDHEIVEFFHESPKHDHLYTFHVVRSAPTFSISIIMRTIESKQIMYKLNKLDGCQFLNNPIMNKVFAHVLNAIIVNKTITSCPILPKVYYLKNMKNPKSVPTFHPAGRFQVTVRILMPQSRKPFVMEMVWRYSVNQGN